MDNRRPKRISREEVSSVNESIDLFSTDDDLKKLKAREDIYDTRANRELRGKYAHKVFLYLVFYSTFVGILLLITGFNLFGFVLAESVLNFLVGSTAASAIGLVLAVTTGLFKPLK